MTAEVAIINRYAIALAADSAVTIGQDKVWKTANKLFSLGPHHDIAIMIYGSGEYLAFPWEVVIKQYRHLSTGKTFATVEDCAKDFIAFLSAPIFSHQHVQDVSVIYPMADFVNAVRRDTAKYSGADRAARAEALCKRYRPVVQKKPKLIADLPFADFATHFRDIVKSLVEHAFDGATSASMVDEFVGLAYDAFCAKEASSFSSGLVIAGFGADEFFPCLQHYNIDGRFKQWLRAWPARDPRTIDPNSSEGSVIIPFAQKDMSHMFMEGITPAYVAYLQKAVAELLPEAIDEFIAEHVPEGGREKALKESKKLARKASKKLMEKFSEHRQDKYINPVMSAVGALPKEEMAAMAEALVDLTSLRRKVDSKLDTVGGPVDVAVISKGDGFIWIKRKFYFKPELNGDFVRRRQIWQGD